MSDDSKIKAIGMRPPMNGLYREWRHNGKLWFEAYCKDGILSGPFKAYNRHEQIDHITSVIKGGGDEGERIDFEY